MNDTPLDAEVVDNPSAQPARKPAGMREMVDNRWLVLAMLFFVTAALGLPVLWMSRAFRRQEKIVLSVVVIIYTGLLLYGFGLVMLWSYNQIVESL